ncbi:hypothetical protein ARMSODRAFT_778572 [Armillaria solidipes]|uniref:Secreted protein n=1 Tax=Armillaria solidipes TaxID=1076256 RepID=A0A2H3BZN5_9AGAR|nr:hypothetical protein ARMSODRAFT_778572 [Armillaria solidipes]
MFYILFALLFLSIDGSNITAYRKGRIKSTESNTGQSFRSTVIATNPDVEVSNVLLQGLQDRLLFQLQRIRGSLRCLACADMFNAWSSSFISTQTASRCPCCLPTVCGPSGASVRPCFTKFG